MLTEQQLIKLESLTLHPKFGEILKNAVKVWKTTIVNPKIGCFGIEANRFTNSWVSTEDCCLIGASMVGKKHFVGNSTSEDVVNTYGIENKKICHAIYDGFDQKNIDKSIFYEDKYVEAHEFGKQVSVILFGELENANTRSIK